MQKVQKGEIERRIGENRERLLRLIEGVDGAVLSQPNTINREYSVIDTLNYLAAWGEMVQKGLREIQRRKKPTELQRAIADRKLVWQQAAEAGRDEKLTDILIRLEDNVFAFEDQIGQLSHDDLNRPKRFRFIGNKPLWPFIAEHTIEHDANWIDDIEHFLNRAA